MPDQNSGWPYWSPDGTRIAFNRDPEGSGPGDESAVWDIFTMDADGGGLVKLTDSVSAYLDAAYSPDGQLIAYGWDQPGQAGIYVMTAADGSDKRRVTTLPADASVDYDPRFSPDGSQLAFTRLANDSTSALFVVNVDGSGLRRITPSSVAPQEKAWSPDGTQIVFDADLVNGRGDAWIIGADGQGLRNLTAGPAVPGRWDGFSDPAWSPDGSLILLIHGLHFDDGTVTAGLATIHPDGTDLRYVGDGTGDEEKVALGTADC